MKPSELLALRAEIGADLDELARVVEEIQKMTQELLPSPSEPSLKDRAALALDSADSHPQLL